MTKLESIFKTEKPLIGMIHFPPLVGKPEYPGFDYIVQKMLKEAQILQSAGFDSIMIENNYDIPHTEKISAQSAAMFGSLAAILQRNITIPFGVNVLWNDHETALSICSSTSAKFIRVPAFVDTVETAYGVMPARAKEVVKLRKKLDLDNIAILADIQVKHSGMVDKKKSLEQSAEEAMKAGANALVVTGSWTGVAPRLEDLQKIREIAKSLPIIVGSGATLDNLEHLSSYADGVIVGTALKNGANRVSTKEVNVKPFTAKISSKKALLFEQKFRETFDL